MLTAVFLILSVVLNTMELPYLDTSGFVFLPVIGVGFLILTLLLCFYKSKPDQNKLQELAAELKRTSLGYFGFLHTTFKGAYDQLDARFNEQLEQLKANAVEEIGETIVELYETVPLRQQPYFLELGVTATCENDFYAIAQECIKAEKTDQQIDLQNYIRQQAREDIDRGVREMKRSMRQIEQEISAGNARIAEQNERNLQNQNKALNELKKQSKQNAELKEKLRDIERNMDN